MRTKEELAEEYIKNLIPLGHERCHSDFLQGIQKAAFLAGYEAAAVSNFLDGYNEGYEDAMKGNNNVD